MDIRLADGKYRLLQNDDGTGLRALRYGEEWRDLTGDNLVSELGHRIEELEDQCGEYRSQLGDIRKAALPDPYDERDISVAWLRAVINRNTPPEI